MDNTQISKETTGDVIATDDIGGVKYQRMKMTLGDDGVDGGDVSPLNPMPVTGGLTDDELRDSPIEVKGGLYQEIANASDNITTINYTDATKLIVSGVTQSSVSVGAIIVETFDHTGVTSLVITRSLPS